MTRRQLALIPARGGSKGLPGKNLAELGGKPLIAHTIEAALQAGLGRVIVSTDDEAIAQAARQYGAEVPELRPAQLATDEATTLDVVAHVIRREALKPSDLLCLLQPTSPLRDERDVRAALELYARHETPIVSMVEADKPLAWYFVQSGERGELAQRFPKLSITRRQDDPERLLLPNGAIYIAPCSRWLEESQSVILGAIAYMMPPERSIDIDRQLDLDIARLLYSRS